MSCREHKREIYKTPQAFSEVITATGEDTDDFTTRTFLINGFRCFVLYVNLPPGETAGPANLPFSIKAWGITDIDDVEGSRVLLQSKCLEGILDWSGHAFLELSETHLGMYQGDEPFTHVQFSIEGDDGVEYELIVTSGCPDFHAPENVLEDFSSTTTSTTTTAAPTTTTTTTTP